MDEHGHLATEIYRWKRQRVIPQFSHLHKNNKFQVIYHNVLSLLKHSKLIENDKCFTSSDVILLGETWLSSIDQIHIHGFELIERTDDGPLRKPRGVCIFINKHLRKQITTSDSFVLKHENSRIDTSWILLNKIKIVAIYCKPQTSSSLWKKWFHQMNLSKTTTENIIILGDFNINSFQENHCVLRWFHRINFNILNTTQPTTQHKTHLDWVVSNTAYKTGTYASYFSYHHPIWA